MRIAPARALARALAIALVLACAPTAAAAQTLAGVVADIPTVGHLPRAARSAAITSLQWGGGPVLHSNHTHLIFWQPSGSGLSFDPGYQALIETFLSQVAADSRKPTNVYSLTGQYHDGRSPAAYNSRYDGALLDTNSLPANGCVEPAPPPVSTGPGWTICLSHRQIDNEVVRLISANQLPTGDPDLYVLVTPRGLGNCESTGPQTCALGGAKTGGYCGYHDFTAGGAIKYAVIPYTAVTGHCQSDAPRPNNSTADSTISVISHEHNEIITDPLRSGWFDPSGFEIGDLCAAAFGPPLGGTGASTYNEVIHGGHYFLQAEWSNDDGGCAARDESDRVSFSVPHHLHANKRGKFTARGHDPDGAIVAYEWSFGDGKSAHRRVVRHTYMHAGTFKVTLRITDSAGLWAFSVRTIAVH